jgi:hypothetical protein
MTENVEYTVCATLALLRLRAEDALAEVALRIPGGGATWVAIAKTSTWPSLHKMNCVGLPLSADSASADAPEVTLRVTAQMQGVPPKSASLPQSLWQSLPLRPLDLRQLKALYPGPGPLNWVQIWNDPRMQLVQWHEPAEPPVEVRGVSLLRPRQRRRQRVPHAGQAVDPDPLGLFAAAGVAEDPLGLWSVAAGTTPTGSADTVAASRSKASHLPPARRPRPPVPAFSESEDPLNLRVLAPAPRRGPV